MSIARTSRCVFCSFKQTIRGSEPLARRQFHSSPAAQTKSKDSNASEQRSSKTDLRKLGTEEIKRHFTPEQAEAIEQTQKELQFSENYQKTTRTNIKPWTLPYFQNLTEIDPVADRPVKAPWSNFDDNSRLKTDDEFDEDMVRFMQNMPQDEEQAAKALEKFLAENRITIGKEEAERNPRSASSPELPTMRSEDASATVAKADGKVSKADEESTKTADQSTSAPAARGATSGPASEMTPELTRLLQMTGLSFLQFKQLRVKTIVRHRVVNQTRLGKISKMYFLSVAGNGNGLLGIGEGKAEEAGDGRLQSQYRAIRNMQPVKRYENRTIFGDVEGKSGATELRLYTRPPGFGIRCQQYIYEMCRCAGIADLAARVTRARNPMNTVKAAYQALMNQKDPEEVAKGRGKKMVDVRKVYYAGNV